MIISLANINWGGGSGGGGGTVRVIDNLESTATTEALSANQGKVIGDHISEAEEVLARGFNQLNNGISQKAENGLYSNTDWSQIEWNGNGFYEVEINGVSQGIRLHASGASTELTNPKVTEITTSATVLRIVTLSQSDYDDLQQAGQLNNNTLYVIVEPLP